MLQCGIFISENAENVIFREHAVPQAGAQTVLNLFLLLTLFTSAVQLYSHLKLFLNALCCS